MDLSIGSGVRIHHGTKTKIRYGNVEFHFGRRSRVCHVSGSRCLDATEGCGSQTSFLDPGRVSIGKLQCKGEVLVHDEVVSTYDRWSLFYEVCGNRCGKAKK